MEKQETFPKAHGRSSTRDILGEPWEGANGHRWSAQYRELWEYRERLLGKRQGQNIAARDEIAISGEHLADAGADSYDRDQALAMACSTQDIIVEIDDALNRIKTGRYGRCELTGERIEAERLRAIPWTRFSAQAQAELEIHGGGRRVQLGQLGSYAQAATNGAEEEADQNEAA